MAGGPNRSSAPPNPTRGPRTPAGRPPRAVAPPPGAGAADREPRHEARRDRRGGVDRHAEGEAEQPDPEDLIDQRADTGAEEQDRKRREHLAEYNRGHSLAGNRCVAGN